MLSTAELPAQMDTFGPDANGVRHPHMSRMEQFDFNLPADVFSVDRKRNKRLAMVYRRFSTGAEALRFAVEGQPADRLCVTVIETDDMRIDADEIARHYASEAYPFERRKAHWRFVSVRVASDGCTRDCLLRH